MYISVSGCKILIAVVFLRRRVVGGTDAGFGSFPWIALIMGVNSRYTVHRSHFTQGPIKDPKSPHMLDWNTLQPPVHSVARITFCLHCRVWNFAI
jgi:hypothetical protein